MPPSVDLSDDRASDKMRPFHATCNRHDQTSPHPDLQMHQMHQAGKGVPPEGFSLFAYPAVHGRVRLRRAAPLCNGRAARGRIVPAFGRWKLVASPLIVS